MWKAIIINKSQVDAGEMLEVTFQVYKDTDLIYDNLIVSATPDNVLDVIKQKGIALKSQVETANEIKIGQEVEL